MISGNIAEQERSMSEKGIIAFVKKGWAEFRDFAFKGNMIDLAIAVVIGAAFSDVIKTVVSEIINPVIGYFFWIPLNSHWIAHEEFWKKFGLEWAHHAHMVLGALINFVIVALAVFVTMVKIAGAVVKKVSDVPAPSEPTTRECPMCLSNIPIKARKCAFCTSDLTAA
jgi:large conductance mechanosensitive channel